MKPALAPVRNVESVSAMQSPGVVAERNQTRIAAACPTPPLAREREGPAPKAWEGEGLAGGSKRVGATPLTLPSPPQRVERE